MKLHEAWRDHLHRLIHQGRRVTVRGQETLELLDQRIVVDSNYPLLDVPSRKLNFRFAVAEWLWIALGHSDVATIAQYNSVMRQFSDDGVFLTGAYGPHINAQWGYVRELLRRDPTTRQAVIEIARPRKATKDEPCTLSLQFIARDGELHQIATMRSSDAWLGIPYDVFTFSQLQNMMAGALGLRRGSLSLRMGSAHLYERDLAAAADVFDDMRRTSLRTANLRDDRAPGWLGDLLRTRDSSVIPELRGSEELEVCAYVDLVVQWRSYAAALLARTSAEAREFLRQAAQEAR